MTDPAKTHRPKASSPKSPKQGVPTSRVAVMLDGSQRRYLRGLAHDLQPVLQIGKAGPTKALVAELDRALEAHELIKIRALRECPSDLGAILDLVQKSLGTSAVGKVGNVLVLYRPRSENPSITLPKRKNAPAKAPIGAKSRLTSE